MQLVWKKKKLISQWDTVREKEERQPYEFISTFIIPFTNPILAEMEILRAREPATNMQAKMCVVKNLYNGRPLDFGAVPLTFLPFRACKLLYCDFRQIARDNDVIIV